VSPADLKSFHDDVADLVAQYGASPAELGAVCQALQAAAGASDDKPAPKPAPSAVPAASKASIDAAVCRAMKIAPETRAVSGTTKSNGAITFHGAGRRPGSHPSGFYPGGGHVA
jgi:hypothetical protein